MYIKSIDIKNIRSIENFEMKFQPPYAGWHVVIGDNGSGKSSLVRAISLALIGPLEARALRQDWSKWIKTPSKEGSVEVGIIRHERFDIESIREIISGTKRKSKTVLSASITCGVKIFEKKQANNDSGVLDDVPTVDIKATESTGKVQRWETGGRRGWFSAAYGPFRRFTGGNKEWEKLYYSNPRAAAHLSAFGEDVALWECIEWLKQLRFQSLEKENRFNESSVELLNNFTNFINNGKVLPHNAKIKRITSTGVDFEDGNGNEVSLFELSDGYRSILSMTFELIRQFIKFYPYEDIFASIKGGSMKIDLPGVVIIDEVDAHLHPTWQVTIGEWFLNIFPNVQFIVTTHSPLICRASENGSIWRLAAPGSGNVSGEIVQTDKERLIFGNVLDAYGTEIFGANMVRSTKSNDKLERLGRLNMLAALDNITKEEERERIELQKIFSTDDPTGQK